jgi:hypothetical protein
VGEGVRDERRGDGIFVVDGWVGKGCGGIDGGLRR